MVRITPIYKPWKGDLEGEQACLGDLLSMLINPLLTGSILQVAWKGYCFIGGLESVCGRILLENNFLD